MTENQRPENPEIFAAIFTKGEVGLPKYTTLEKAIREYLIFPSESRALIQICLLEFDGIENGKLKLRPKSRNVKGIDYKGIYLLKKTTEGSGYNLVRYDNFQRLVENEKESVRINDDSCYGLEVVLNEIEVSK